MADRPIFYILAGLAVAAGPALAGFFVFKGLTESRMADRYVTVKGLVERVEKADHGTAKIGYKVAGNDIIELNKELQKQQDSVISFLKSTGFTAEEIRSSAPQVIDTQAQKYGDGRSPFRYIISMATTVESDNVDKLTNLANHTSNLVDKGLNMSSFVVNYQLKKFNDLRPAMIAEATKNAKELAIQFAENSGSIVGAIRRANQGVMTITSPNATPNDQWSTGETSVMKKVRVVSTLDFYLKD